MIIDISGEQQRVCEFRGPGCRKKMLLAYRVYRDRAIESDEVERVCVWGTVGGTTEIALEWARE